MSLDSYLTSPIHWERYGSRPTKLVDVRTLPEETKVTIIKAALGLTFHYDNGEFDLSLDAPEAIAMEQLAHAVHGIDKHMHEVSLTPCP